MQYLSFTFLGFVIVVWGIYSLMPQKHRWKILLVASLFFYMAFDVKYIFFLLFVAISTYLGARCIAGKNNKKILWITLGCNIILWFLIKALPWCGTILNTIVGKIIPNYVIEIPSILVPVGISYYVLMAISYLVDVYKGKVVAENNFAKYLLYLSYFPAVVQGPISRYEMLQGQLFEGKRISYNKFRYNILLIAIGVVKKMVIADRVALVANDCYENYMKLEGPILYVGAVFYSIQLYMDFSGCVDICRGVSGLFGVELIDNFNAPYFAKSIKEFWSKWHISLSSWLKDYVYIPLGGNRKGKMRKYANLLITFLVSGIWHGAGFSFLVWGMLHGIYQIVGELSTGIRSRIKQAMKIESGSISERIYQTILTFNLVTFAWIFFRANTLMSAVEYIKRMFSSMNMGRLFDESSFVAGLDYAQSTMLILNIVVISVMDYYHSKKNVEVREAILNAHFFIRWSIYFLIALDILLFGVYGQGYDLSGFLYGGF